MGNIDFMLTTHYVLLCNMLNNNKNISNQQMLIKGSTNTYKLIKGISNIKGGIKVLEELNYSEKIILSAKKAIKTIDL